MIVVFAISDNSRCNDIPVHISSRTFRLVQGLLRTSSCLRETLPFPIKGRPWESGADDEERAVQHQSSRLCRQPVWSYCSRWIREISWTYITLVLPKACFIPLGRTLKSKEKDILGHFIIPPSMHAGYSWQSPRTDTSEPSQGSHHSCGWPLSPAAQLQNGHPTFYTPFRK